MVNMTDITRNIPKNSSLYNCLTEVKLDKFYDNFVSKRITTCEKLATISIVDFEHYGIISMNDRLRLFQLIQIIKSVAFKNQNPGFKEQTDFNKNKIKKVVSDDQLVSTHKSKSHTKLPWDGHNDLKMESIKQLEEETSKLLQDEKMRRPLSSTSEGMLNYQEPSADAKKRLNLFKSYKDNESKQKMQNSNSPDEITDENTSRNAKIPNKQYEDTAFSSYPKSSKEDRVNENEKPLMVKETFHNGGYNYGVPHQKFPSRNIPQVTKGIGSGKASPDKVKVCVRKRPRNAREINSNDPDVVVIKGKNTVVLQEQKTALNLTRYIHQHVMTFDEVFDETNTNVDVYKSTIKPLVSFVLKRGTAICFTFGQTGAGKTHTLIGDKSHPGLYQLAGRDLFESIQISGDANVWVSFYEIYCGQLFDLLNNRKKLVLMEKHNKQVCVTGLMETHATDLRSLIHIINFGRIHRSKGSSGVNPVSSRSHAVLQLDVRSTETNKRIGRLTFIDLAGSERASDAMMCNKQTRYEGAEINQSLLALKECIRSLDQEQSYTPYRQSKLTHILRESFSGNCQTVMIANISPTLSACENTLNTLRYADRVQELKKASQQKMKSNPKKFKDLENSFPSNSNPSPPPPSKPMLDQGSKSRNDSPSLSTTIIRSPLFLFHIGNASSTSNTEIGSPSNVSPADMKFISTPAKTVSSTFSNDHPPKFSQNVMKENEKNSNLYPDIVERFRNEICNDHLEKERKLSRKEVVAENQTPSRKGTKLRNPCDNRAFMCPQSDKSLTVERNCRSQPSRSGSSQNYKYEKLVPERETKLIANFFGTNPQIFLKKLQGYRIKDHKDSQTVFLLRSSHMAKPKSPHDKNRRKSPKLSDSKTDVRKKHKMDSKERGSSLPLNSQKKPSVDKSNELPQKHSDQENFANQPDNGPEKAESSEITSSDASRKFYQDAFTSLPVKSDEISNNRDFQVDSSLNASNSIVDGQNAINPSSPINYVLNSESLLVNAHEKHLDSVTQLCREEIDLLMKLRTGQMPFHNYVSKIRGIMATRKQMSDALINHIGQFESFNNSLS